MSNWSISCIRFSKWHAYSTINSVKCEIATIVHIPSDSPLNKHPLTNKYMTAVFNLRPWKPKLRIVWDVGILIRYVEQQGNNTSLPYKLLKQKLLNLLLLLGAQRFSTVKLFTVSNMVLNSLSAIFHTYKNIKTLSKR